MRISDWSSDVCSSDLRCSKGNRPSTAIGSRKNRVAELFFANFLNPMESRGLASEAGEPAGHREAEEGKEPHGIGRHRHEDRTGDRGVLIEPVEKTRDRDSGNPGDEEDRKSVV